MGKLISKVKLAAYAQSAQFSKLTAQAKQWSPDHTDLMLLETAMIGALLATPILFFL